MRPEPEELACPPTAALVGTLHAPTLPRLMDHVAHLRRTASLDSMRAAFTLVEQHQHLLGNERGAAAQRLAVDKVRWSRRCPVRQLLGATALLAKGGPAPPARSARPHVHVARGTARRAATAPAASTPVWHMTGVYVCAR